MNREKNKDALLWVRELSIHEAKSGKPIVTNASFEIGRGQLVGLVGKSGAGKSTLAFAIPRLLPRGLKITKGNIWFHGKDICSLQEQEIERLRGIRIATVFQDPLSSLNPLVRCGRQLEDPLIIHSRLSPPEREKKIHLLLSELGLSDVKRICNSFPHQISGGQRQRVLLAMAVMLKPDLLIADEPTSALDKEAEDDFLQLLGKLRNSRGVSVLLVSHNLSTVQYHCDVMYELEDQTVSKIHAGNIERHKWQSTTGLESDDSHGYLQVLEMSKCYDKSRLNRSNQERDLGLKKLTFAVNKGEVFGITGKSGIGKTTLLRCIAGLEQFDTGKIMIDGKPILRKRKNLLSVRPNPVQLIYQNPYASLNPKMSIGETVGLALGWKKLKEAVLYDAVIDLLNKVRLTPNYYNRLPEHLSGGERQRVAIARCLAAEPLLLAADEPTASLDTSTAETILELFRSISKDFHVTVVIVSHNIEQLQKVCQRVLSLNEQRILSP